MAKRKQTPARTPEARENQLINLAVDETERRLRNGTASSQILTVLLKLATTRAIEVTVQMKMNTMTTYRTYSELVKIEKFEDRFKYLSLVGIVGETTFGGHRYLNQIFYQTDKWKSTRREVILRDNGCDLAHPDYSISGSIYIHHLNPITIDDILEERPCVFDLENLISTAFRTHNAIHYGSEDLLPKGPVERKKNDTCLWR